MCAQLFLLESIPFSGWTAESITGSSLAVTCLLIGAYRELKDEFAAATTTTGNCQLSPWASGLGLSRLNLSLSFSVAVSSTSLFSSLITTP